MSLWKRLSNRFKRYEKWIEIKVPRYLQNREDPFIRDREILDDEENVLQNLKLEREEE